MILLGNSDAIRRFLPQNKITIEFRTNPVSIEYSARTEFQEALFTGLDHIWDYLNQPASNPTLHYQDGPYIYDVPSFNEKSIREALLNAICHRSYLIHSDVVVKQSSEFLEITNAGGFPVGVDLDNILTTNSVPRNKLLCEVLQKTGLIERSGQGVDKMFYQSIVDGKALPSYANTDAFQVSIKFSAAIENLAFLKYITKIRPKLKGKRALSVQEIVALRKICLGDHEVIDESIRESLRKKDVLPKTNELFENSPPGTTLETTPETTLETHLTAREKIIMEIKNNPKISKQELAKVCGLTIEGIRYHIKNLRKQGVLRWDGSNPRWGQWNVDENKLLAKE